MAYVLPDGYYWVLSTPATTEWIIVSLETRDDLLGSLAGLPPARHQVVCYIGSDYEETLDAVCKEGAQFEGPLERSAVPGLTTIQLRATIEDFKRRGQSDSAIAQAYEVAFEALAMIESFHGK